MDTNYYNYYNIPVEKLPKQEATSSGEPRNATLEIYIEGSSEDICAIYGVIKELVTKIAPEARLEMCIL